MHLLNNRISMARPKTISDADILRTAREVFIEGGALGSTREIAKRMNVSEATLFKRFPTKAELFLAAMAPPPVDVDELTKLARAQPDARRALRLIAEFTLAYFRDAIPRMLPLITHPAIGVDDLQKRFGKSPAAVLNAAIARYVSDQHRSGALNAPKPQAVAGLIVATMHSIVLFELLGLHDGAIPRSAMDAMLETLWTGVAPAKAPSRRRPTRR